MRYLGFFCLLFSHILLAGFGDLYEEAEFAIATRDHSYAIKKLTEAAEYPDLSSQKALKLLDLMDSVIVNGSEKEFDAHKEAFKMFMGHVSHVPDVLLHLKSRINDLCRSQLLSLDEAISWSFYLEGIAFGEKYVAPDMNVLPLMGNVFDDPPDFAFKRPCPPAKRLCFSPEHRKT